MVSRSSLLSCACLAALAVSMNTSFAADLDTSDGGYYNNQPTYNGAPPADWTGAYMGAMLGYNWGTFDPATGATVDTSGILVGGFVGYNFQMGAIVLGGEADVVMTSMDGSSGTNSADADWIGTARARLGYAWSRHLVYGTAGLTFMSADMSLNGPTDDNTHIGLVGGAGWEVMLNKSFSARGEYLYSAYGDKEYSNVDTDTSTHAIRAGVGYHF